MSARGARVRVGKEDSAGTSHGRLRPIVVGVGLVLGAALVAAPMLLYPFGRDQAMFACGADVLRRGGALYRDFWDVKPPGVYWLYWGSFAAFGRSMLAPRVMDFLFSLGTAGALVLIGRRLGSLWGGAAAGFAFLVRYTLGFDYWGSAQGDGLASLPLTLAVLVMLRAEHRRNWRWAALSGALVGVAIAIKFTLGIVLVLPLAAIALSKGEELAARLARLSGYVLGAGAVVGVAMAAIWRTGALGEMLEIMFSWNAHYAQIRASGSGVAASQVARFWLGGTHVILPVIGALALVGLTDLAARRREVRLWWVPAGWLALMLVQTVMQGKYFQYHWLPALPPLGLLAGDGLAALWRVTGARIGRTGGRRAAAAVGLAGLVALVAGGWIGQFRPEIARATGRMSAGAFAAGFRDRQDYSLSADLQVARFLDEHLATGGCTFIWGFEPAVYFLANRPPATRFISMQPLVTPWSPPEWRRELIADLDSRKPPYILALHNDAMPWVTLRPGDSAQNLADFPELTQLLATDYRPYARIEDFDIWERG